MFLLKLFRRNRHAEDDERLGMLRSNLEERRKEARTRSSEYTSLKFGRDWPSDLPPAELQPGAVPEISRGAKGSYSFGGANFVFSIRDSEHSN